MVPELSPPPYWTASRCRESLRRWWLACCASTTCPAPGCSPASTSPPSLHPSRSCTTSIAASASRRRAGLRAQSLPCSLFSVLGQVKLNLKVFNQKHLWSGLLHLSHPSLPSRPLASLLDTLYLPSYDTRKTILDLVYKSLRLQVRKFLFGSFQY